MNQIIFFEITNRHLFYPSAIKNILINKNEILINLILNWSFVFMKIKVSLPPTPSSPPAQTIVQSAYLTLPHALRKACCKDTAPM